MRVSPKITGLLLVCYLVGIGSQTVHAEGHRADAARRLAALSENVGRLIARNFSASPEGEALSWQWSAMTSAYQALQAESKEQKALSEDGWAVLKDGDSEAGRLPTDLILISLRSEMLTGLAPQQIAERRQVQEVVVGTPAVGMAVTEARPELVIVPDANRAVIQVRVRGQIHSQTSGANGPVTIGTSSQTDFVGTKTIVLSSRGLHLLPAASHAVTRSTTTGISTDLPGLRGRIARRIAEARIEDQRDQINAESAHHAEAHINAALDLQGQQLAAQLNRRLQPLFAVLPGNVAWMPNQLCCRSTPEGLLICLRRVADPTNAPMPSWDAIKQEEALASIKIHGGIIRSAWNDARLRLQARPIIELLGGAALPKLTSLHVESPLTVASLRPDIAWSPDHMWLTLRWRGESASRSAEHLAAYPR